MARRTGFRPTTVDSLENRVTPSHAGLHSAEAPALHAAVKASRAYPVTVGALGDSYTDEYRFYPPHQSHARNWVEILAATRRANFGAFTRISRGEPRDQGFATNWARYGSTTSDLVASQLPGLATQVAKGQVQYAWIFSGGNDFLYFLQGAETSGFSQPDALLAQLGQVKAQAEANIQRSVDTLLAASPNVRLVVATVPDVSALPIVRQGVAGNAAAQALVAATSQAVQDYNGLIRSIAAGSDRVALADLAGQASSLLQGSGNGGTTIAFGGTTLDLATPGDGYRHVFLGDGLHVGTVAQGLIADAFIQAIDSTFGARVPLLLPTQIVAFARHVGPGTP